MMVKFLAIDTSELDFSYCLNLVSCFFRWQPLRSTKRQDSKLGWCQVGSKI